jgi:hypothetical protein
MVTLNGSNVSGQDFTASTQSACYTISGRITNSGFGFETTVTLSAAGKYLRTRSDENGYYYFYHIPNGTYTISPGSSSGSFSPSSITATVNGANLSGQNFVYYY